MLGEGQLVDPAAQRVVFTSERAAAASAAASAFFFFFFKSSLNSLEDGDGNSPQTLSWVVGAPTPILHYVCCSRGPSEFCPSFYSRDCLSFQKNPNPTDTNLKISALWPSHRDHK